MANCQNNMRYGRQMNNYNSCRNNMPANNNNCRNMPVQNKPCNPTPMPMPKTNCQRSTPEPCECRRPEPCGTRKPEPCEIRKPEPCECRRPEPCETRKPEPCECRKPEPCECRKPEPCECRKPEPCEYRKPGPCEYRKPEPWGCSKPEPRNNDCMSRPRSVMEEQRSECNMMKRRNPKPCGCQHDALEGFPIAMAYVPWQKWRDVLDPCRALQHGTIFEELFKPFKGRGGCNR